MRSRHEAGQDTVAGSGKAGELDFEAFSKQDWERFQESHAGDVTVVWPDGRRTTGPLAHVDDLKYVFSYAPDARIVSPVSFGGGEWTAEIGVMTGTFTRPMVTDDGREIPPTGRRFSIPLAAIARWKDGRRHEEHLFWDNQTFMRQLGLAS